MHVDRSITADEVVTVLERLVSTRGAPAYLRCDNGTELTAHALIDWCRFSATSTSYIDPGSPSQNAFVESFNGRVRDELLNVEEFFCLAEARVVIGDWHEDYNTRRPHSALGMRTPAAFAAAWSADPTDDARPLAAARADGQRPSVPVPHPSGSHSRWIEERGPVSHAPTLDAAVRTRSNAPPKAREPSEMVVKLKAILPPESGASSKEAAVATAKLTAAAECRAAEADGGA